jgi:hypothetical protein
LLPLKRFGITSYGQIAYHDYDGPGFRPEERTKFVTDLGDIWCYRRRMLSKKGADRAGRDFDKIGFDAVVRQLSRIDPTYRD